MIEEIQVEEICIFDLEFICIMHEWLNLIKKNMPEIQAEAVIHRAISKSKFYGYRGMSRSMWSRLFINQILDLFEDLR